MDDDVWEAMVNGTNNVDDLRHLLNLEHLRLKRAEVQLEIEREKTRRAEIKHDRKPRQLAFDDMATKAAAAVERLHDQRTERLIEAADKKVKPYRPLNEKWRTWPGFVADLQRLQGLLKDEDTPKLQRVTKDNIARIGTDETYTITRTMKAYGLHPRSWPPSAWDPEHSPAGINHL